jgi:hypothetical protein
MHTKPCPGCGAPIRSDDPRHVLCLMCANRANGRVRHEANRARVEALWAAGLTTRQVLSALGLKHNTSMLSTWRSRGYDLPYRLSPEQRARQRAGMAARMAALRARKAQP